MILAWLSKGILIFQNWINKNIHVNATISARCNLWLPSIRCFYVIVMITNDIYLCLGVSMWFWHWRHWCRPQDYLCITTHNHDIGHTFANGNEELRHRHLHWILTNVLYIFHLEWMESMIIGYYRIIKSSLIIPINI